MLDQWITTRHRQHLMLLRKTSSTEKRQNASTTWNKLKHWKLISGSNHWMLIN